VYIINSEGIVYHPQLAAVWNRSLASVWNHGNAVYGIDPKDSIEEGARILNLYLRA